MDVQVRVVEAFLPKLARRLEHLTEDTDMEKMSTNDMAQACTVIHRLQEKIIQALIETQSS